MNCPTCREYLSAYLDNELPTEQRELIAEHLSLCASCRQELEWQAALWDLLEVMPVDIPVGLVDKVMARLPGRANPSWRYLALAASLLLGIFLGGKLGLDLNTTLSSQPEQQVVALEVFDDLPQGSVATVLTSYDLDNGNGA